MPTNPPERPLVYKSFILRLWREAGTESGWRVALEDPNTGRRHGFGSVEDLPAYLRGWIHDAQEVTPSDDRTSTP